MARPYVGPRLYRRNRTGFEESWIIRDGQVEISTFHKDVDLAQKVLEQYCAEKGVASTKTPRTGERRYPETTIYFISTTEVDGHPIKIGITDMGIERRIRVLQNACPYKLVALASFSGTRNTERELHRRFAASRMEREWFARTPELMAYISEVSGEFHGKTPEKWSERLDSNQRPLSPQETPDA